MRHGKQKTQVSKTIPETRGKKAARRRKKWCPFPQCSKICVHMDKHLQNVHKLKVVTVPYKVYLKEAKTYKGIMELDDLPRSVPGPQPSTSAVAPAVTASPADCEDGSSTSEETQMCPPTDLESHCKSDAESSSSGSAYQPAGVTKSVCLLFRHIL